jgi:hypothetical protein
LAEYAKGESTERRKYGEMLQVVVVGGVNWLSRQVERAPREESVERCEFGNDDGNGGGGGGNECL